MTGFSELNGRCSDDCLIRNAVAGLSVGLVIVDPTGKVVWLNRAATRILDVKPEDCIQHQMDHAIQDPRLAAFWQDANGDERSYAADLSLTWPREVEVKVSVSICSDKEGVEIGRALIICDVTEERKVQLELTQAVATRLLDLTSGHMPPKPVQNLTQQELRMLRLVGRGLGNEEIADQTSISASTVRTHLKSLYRKLNLTSRTEAVSFAVRHHLV